MAIDIGQLIFVELLRMTNYPGSPFTGNIVNDLIMFLFIPSVFIIVIVYTLVGRMTDSNKLKLLLGIAFYLFIIAGGYYNMFALLAGPYFIIMLIIVGVVFFFLGHFGLFKKDGGGQQIQHMPGRAAEAASGEIIHQYQLLLENYRKGEDEYKLLKEQSKENPALDRLLAEQKKSISDTKHRIIELEVQIQHMKLGGNFQNTLRQLKHRYGIK